MFPVVRNAKVVWAVIQLFLSLVSVNLVDVVIEVIYPIGFQERSVHLFL